MERGVIPFIDSFHCKSQAHCSRCRASAEWRKNAGAPDVCPVGKPLAEGGPGTELKKILKRLGIVASPGCACNRKAAEMDRRGVAWCEAHLDEIAAVMEGAAQKRDWLRFAPFKKIGAKRLVKMAIRRARKTL